MSDYKNVQNNRAQRTLLSKFLSEPHLEENMEESLCLLELSLLTQYKHFLLTHELVYSLSELKNAKE